MSGTSVLPEINQLPAMAIDNAASKNPLYWLGLITSIVMHLLLAVRNLVYLDRIFLPDDTYYVLAIARNMAHGRGPSADGVILTSGFQPLSAFLLTPIFLATSDRDLPVYLAILISAFFGVLNTVLVGLIVSKLTKSRMAAGLAMFWSATCPVLLSNDLNGLETSLASFTALLLVYSLCRLSKEPSWPALCEIGVCCGAALLARIDNAILVVLVGLWCLTREGMRRTSLIVAAAIVVVLPWWSYCFLHFNSIIPESGAAVRQIVRFYYDCDIDKMRSTHFGMEKSLEVIGGTIAGGLGNLSIVLGLAILCLSAASILRCLARKHVDTLGLLSVAGIASVGFYTFYLPAWWFFGRYFHFYILTAIISALTLLSDVVSVRNAARIWSGIMLAAVAFFLAFSFPQLKELRSSPEVARGGYGYGEIAKQVLPVLPQGTILGATQSGALGYYAGDSLRVINLDGVVNGDAYRAAREKRIGEYLRQNSASYYIGWDVNVVMLGWTAKGSQRFSIDPLGAAKPQGGSRFVLYKLLYD